MKSLLSNNLRKRAVRITIAIAAIVLSYLVFMQHRVVSTAPITAWQKDPSADCAVVLTGGPGRVREGLSLLSRNLVKKLIISGVHPDVEFGDLYASWIYMGEIDEKDVLLEHRSSTTYGNAQQSLPIVEAVGCRDAILVTSQYHMPRAYLTFVGAFPQGFPIYKHALAAGRGESTQFEIWVEVLKGLFYALWAY